MSLAGYRRFLERAQGRRFTRQFLNEFNEKRASFFRDWVPKILSAQTKDGGFIYDPYSDEYIFTDDISFHEHNRARKIRDDFRKLADHFLERLKTETEQTNVHVDDCLNEKVGYLIELGYKKSDYDTKYMTLPRSLEHLHWTHILGASNGPSIDIRSEEDIARIPAQVAEILSMDGRFVVSVFSVLIGIEGHHANTLIFDKKTLQVYQFEPHGETYDLVESTLFFPFTLVRTNEFVQSCPVQVLEDSTPLSKFDVQGYCFFWSLLYAYLFITCTFGSLKNRVQQLENVFYGVYAQQGRKNLFRRMIRGMAHAMFSDNTCSRRSKALCEFDRNCEWVSNWKGRIGRCQLRTTRFLKNVVQLSSDRYKFKDVELAFEVHDEGATIYYPAWHSISHLTARKLLCHLLQMNLDSGQLSLESHVHLEDDVPFGKERPYINAGFKIAEKNTGETDQLIVFEATVEELLAKCV